MRYQEPLEPWRLEMIAHLLRPFGIAFDPLDKRWIQLLEDVNRKVPRQSDPYNCGSHLISMCAAICNNLDIADTQREMPLYRTLLYSWINTFDKNSPQRVPLPPEETEQTTFASVLRRNSLQQTTQGRCRRCLAFTWPHRHMPRHRALQDSSTLLNAFASQPLRRHRFHRHEVRLGPGSFWM